MDNPIVTFYDAKKDVDGVESVLSINGWSEK